VQVGSKAWDRERAEESGDPEGVDATDEWGRTPLMWATLRGQVRCHEMTWCQPSDGSDPCPRARGQIAAARRLIDEGAKLDARDVDGWTALMWAASAGKADMCAAPFTVCAVDRSRGLRGGAVRFRSVELLLGSGADADAETLPIDGAARPDATERGGALSAVRGVGAAPRPSTPCREGWPCAPRAA
jgi:hypothetical protein